MPARGRGALRWRVMSASFPRSGMVGAEISGAISSS
jgi:hypothetical protein